MQTISVNIDQLKALLKTRFAQGLKNPKMRPKPIYIEGHAGIGKTEIVNQCATELSAQLKENVGFVILNLQFMERPDFMGLAFVDEYKRTQFASPTFLPHTGYGIILLDEANRVDQDIRSGMLTLLQDRSINGNKIGDGWLIVLAGNPMDTNETEGKYEVNELDSALQDRMTKVILKPNTEALVKYLETKYSAEDPLIKELRRNSSLVSFQGNGISPRSFEFLLRSLLGVTDSELKKLIVAAEVGVEASLKLAALLAGDTSGLIDLLKCTEIETDAKFAKLATRLDLQAYLLEDLLKDFDDRVLRKKSYGEIERKNIIKFLSIISNELRMSLLVRVNKSQSAREFFEQFVKGTVLAARFAHLTAVKG
jgi:MoxR-like ATPase